MGKEITSKGRVIDDAFRREAVRILATSGRTIKAVATDLGIGIHPGFRRCVRRSVPGEHQEYGPPSSTRGETGLRAICARH